MIIGVAIVALLLSPLTAAAQSSVRRIGVLNPFPSSSLDEGLCDGIQKAGYIEGQTIIIDWRQSTAPEEELRSLASDMARARVDLIVAMGSPAARAALQIRTVPVVTCRVIPWVPGSQAQSAGRAYCLL
jgi:ABC-type uncharacterized transport system substrate-binding protein